MTDGIKLAASNLPAAVVTVSDSVARGSFQDDSGAEAVRILGESGFDVFEHCVVADEKNAIAEKILNLSREGAALVVTTGGTGVGPRDVTPEATARVSDRMVPGLGELMRTASAPKTPYAVLSRATAGIIGRSLVVNLPGSPGAVRDCLQAVLPVIPHALGLIRSEPTPHLQT